MYAESIVQERIGYQEEELQFKLEYHSVDEVLAFKKRLSEWETVDDNGKVTFSRGLTPEEHRFILNEQALATCDAAYWMTRYAYLSDETNTKVLFKFRDTQKIYFSIISKLEEQLRAIELIVGKGRQQFVTTVTELLDCHRTCYYDDVTCFTASADSNKSAEMMTKVLFCYDNLPWWLRPTTTRRVENIPGMLEFGGINSRMRVVHGSGTAKKKGGQKSGIARGTTPTIYHLSEVSEFPNPEQQIQAAIFRSVHASPKVFGVLESTFSGDKGWFPDQYKFAKDQLRDGGVSRLYPLFFSWPCNRDLYPTKSWIRSNPIPHNWSPSGKVAEQILKAELFIRHSYLLSGYFGKSWKMPLEQQWYYACQYLEHERTGALSTLLQEMPCDDIEAMQSSYDNVFGRQVITICNTRRDRDYDVYGIVGTAIDSSFDPDIDDIDYSRDRVSLRHTTPRGDSTYEWELIPLKSNMFDELDQAEPDDYETVEKFKPLQDGKLFVYHQALLRDTFETSLGVDTSNGISQDSSVISGSTKGNGLVPDIQLASFRSEYVNHVQAFAFAMPIALLMKKLNHNPSELHRWPLCGIEQIAAVGDTCQVQLRRMGYPTGRFFRFGRYDGLELNKKSSQKVGWYTVRWSRDLLVGYIVHAVKNGWYKPNSPWLIDECRTFEIHFTSTGKEKMEHSSDTHDDEIFAAAISTFINHDLDTLADRGNKKLMPKDETDMPEVDITPSFGLKLNPDNRLGRSQITIADLLRGDTLDRYRY